MQQLLSMGALPSTLSSRAKPRDLRFSGPFVEMFFDRAKRSGGTCGSHFWRPLGFEMSKRDHHYFVYIVASRTHVLCCGMTDSLTRRVEEHRLSAIPGLQRGTNAIASSGTNVISTYSTPSVGRSR